MQCGKQGAHNDVGYRGNTRYASLWDAGHVQYFICGMTAVFRGAGIVGCAVVGRTDIFGKAYKGAPALGIGGGKPWSSSRLHQSTMTHTLSAAPLHISGPQKAHPQ